MESTRTSVVMDAISEMMCPDEGMADLSTQAKVEATWCVEGIK